MSTPFDHIPSATRAADYTKPTATARMSRREEVEAELEYLDNAFGIAADARSARRKVLTLTLADEIEALRMAQGCTRGQRTTQYCAEAADRDRVIGELLKMLKPEPIPLPYDMRGKNYWIESVRHDVLTDLYARACAIAGRTE